MPLGTSTPTAASTSTSCWPPSRRSSASTPSIGSDASTTPKPARSSCCLLIIWPQPGPEEPHAAGRFVIECKVLRKSLEQTILQGLEQTAGYMDRCAAQAGHLVVFDRTEGKRWEDRVFRREERTDGAPTITIWGM